MEDKNTATPTEKAEELSDSALEKVSGGLYCPRIVSINNQGELESYLKKGYTIISDDGYYYTLGEPNRR